MKVAVVILNYNGASMLSRFLPLVIEYSPGAEIVVADNASTDNSVTVVTKDFPGVRLIQLERNYGFADGYNKALEQVDAEYFLLLNSDVEVTEGWLEPLLSFMEENSNAVACQPKILA
jgi:GT2 family glycosyltransferase